MTVLAFGKIAAITGDHFELTETLTDTNALQELLHQKFVALQGLKYRLAVNKQMVEQNVSLHNGVTIALLPPFSGG